MKCVRVKLLLACVSSIAAHHASAQIQQLLCGPIPAVCNPTTTIGGLGLTNVTFNQINNSSGIPVQLEDFTCSDSTWLTPGTTYMFYATTGQVYEESVKAWIDFNNDGAFDPTELIYEDSALVYMHAGSYTAPAVIQNIGIPLRMRVGSDYAGNPLLNGCNNTLYGQYEDYTIYFGSGGTEVEESKYSSVSLFPNVFSESAALVFETKSVPARIEIYNSTGSLVRSEQLSQSPCSLHRRTLVSGIYFLRLNVNDGRFRTEKFVIID